MGGKRLIEEWLPLKEVNLSSEIEMAFRITRQSGKLRQRFLETFKVNPKILGVGTPQIQNLHLWLARRPCSAARVLTCTSLLEADHNRDDLLKIIGLSKISELAKEKILPILINVNPDRELLTLLLQKKQGKKLEDIIVVDPMAGGGSIPLESLRLGFRTIAMDYNPIAYLILKATLEYPAKYGEKLYEDVRKEAKALIEFAKNELAKYYPEDTYNYIIARGFECPNCKGLVPVIHNTRLNKDGPYIKFEFDKEKKSFSVSIDKEETEFNRLRCPYCERPFTNEEVLKQWVQKHKGLLKAALEQDVEEVKKFGNTLLCTHILLVKQTEAGFSPCGKEDADKFIQAYLSLASDAKELRTYLPDSLIPEENKVLEPINELGIRYWYELFNPRQLLVFLKTIKHVNKRIEEIIRDKEEYGVAVAIYLALGIDKLLDYNNVATMWHTHRGTINRLGDQYASKKSVGLGLEYCELVVPLENKSIGWVYEPDIEKPTATHGGICPMLKQLCNWLNGLGDRIEVYMADARELSKVLGENSVDLINVDPPYFNQHFYSDLSEFFWQSLSQTLKPAIEAGYLFNRNKQRGRVECLVPGWNPSLPIVLRAGELIVRETGRKNKTDKDFSKVWWTEQMWRFFTEAFRTLKDDGVLIVWYTHSDPQAWEAVLSSLYASDFTITKVWNVRSEAGRFIARLGGSAFFTTLVLVARKTGERVIVGESEVRKLLSNERVKQTIMRSVEDAFESAKMSGASEREAYIMALAGAIAGATRLHNAILESSIKTPSSEKLDKYMTRAEELDTAKHRFEVLQNFFHKSLYPVALYLGAIKALESELVKAGLSEEEVRLIVEVDDITRAYLVFWISTRYYEGETLPYIDYDFVEKICKVLDIGVGRLENFGFLKKVKNNLYVVPFGREIEHSAGRKLETLTVIVAGQAIYLIDQIVNSPIRDDVEKCAKYVLQQKPVSKQAIAVALFLLKTARED
ncbi:MAG: hypothetical protein QXO76_06045, partial [Thermoproteota archaeon]